MSNKVLNRIRSPTRPNQMTIGCRAGAVELDDIRASLRRLRPSGTPYEAIPGTPLLRREEIELLEPCLDGAQGAAVSRGNVGQRVSGLECRDERGFLVPAPRTADVAGQLRSPLRASRRLLQCGYSREQCPQDVSLLQNRTGGQLRAAQGID